MHWTTLVDYVARQGDSRDEIICACGLSVFDMKCISIWRQEAELATDHDEIVGRGCAVLYDIRKFC